MLVGAALIGALFVPTLAPPLPRLAVAAAEGPWRRFDAAAIGGLVRDGHVVMVDVTADWCLNCKINERLVLDRAPVRDDLTKPGVVAGEPIGHDPIAPSIPISPASAASGFPSMSSMARRRQGGCRFLNVDCRRRDRGACPGEQGGNS